MKELLLQLAKYNVWSNKKFIAVLAKLTEEQVNADIVSSYPTIQKTVLHMWSAEYIWQQRLALVEQPIWAQSTFDGTLDELCLNWQKTSKELVKFIEDQRDDNAFTHVVQYYDLKKNASKVQVYACLMQVFNHASYHRGQLVTMLRQVGVKKIPQTDFYLFAKK